MKDPEIINQLVNIPREEWKKAVEKCYIHMECKLYNKTSSGAHCSQRLGAEPMDFYISNCIEGLYLGEWSWLYERFSIAEQMIRIINSMISEQVRKYKVEVKKAGRTVLIENAELIQSLDNNSENVEEWGDYDEENFEKMHEALSLACEGNKKYKQFILLKKEGLGYDDICKQLNCSIKEAYQMMETISRRAIKQLKSL